MPLRLPLSPRWHLGCEPRQARRPRRETSQLPPRREAMVAIGGPELVIGLLQRVPVYRIFLPMSGSAARFPQLGTRFTRALAHRLLALGGWRITGALPNEPRFVIIVAPHTSNWDFLIGVLGMFAVGVRLNWLGKHTLFRFPAGPLLRWLGGEPIDRTTNRGTVDVAIERFRTRRQWVLGIAPEGTRKRVEQWKTGFHQIAVGAGVPIVPVYLDYRRRVVGLGASFRPAGDPAKDVPALRAIFRSEMARHPARFAE
jgi:1-acyl-sn-glycerol-3-phosphate acyltransferase